MVVYLVCYDLSKPLDEQREQMRHWIEFLNSALPLPQTSTKYNDNSKLVIIPVGLKSDLMDPSKPTLKPVHLLAWTSQFPRLPIFPHLFRVSAVESEASIIELKHAIEGQCNRIFSKHSILIPSAYRGILKDLQSLPESAIRLSHLFDRYSHGLTFSGFHAAIHYLAAIGRIVALKSGIVYPDPKIATKTAAKFVSPEEVRMSLLTSDGVEILDEQQVGYLLNIGKSSNKYLVSLLLSNVTFAAESWTKLRWCVNWGSATNSKFATAKCLCTYSQTWVLVHVCTFHWYYRINSIYSD